MMLHTIHQRSKPCGFRKEVFSYFPYISLCKTCGLSGIIFTNLVEVHKVMLLTKYQGFRPCGFRQEDIVMFLLT